MLALKRHLDMLSEQVLQNDFLVNQSRQVEVVCCPSKNWMYQQPWVYPFSGAHARHAFLGPLHHFFFCREELRKCQENIQSLESQLDDTAKEIESLELDGNKLVPVLYHFIIIISKFYGVLEDCFLLVLVCIPIYFLVSNLNQGFLIPSQVSLYKAVQRG